MFKEILLDENIELYKDYYDRATFKTIYHHPQFLLAEEKAEDYYTYLYIYEEKEQYVILPSIKRRVNDIDVFANESEEYFDLITPHEYSGVLANTYDIELFQRFYKELENYCINNSIIFQFIRFNPYSEEYKAALNFNVTLADEQNWIDCKEDVLAHYQKRKSRYVRAAIKNGIECREEEKSEKNIEIFYLFYVKSMDRLNAKKFLYFNKEYFFKLCECECAKLFFIIDSKTQIILSGIIVLCDVEYKRIYHHLSFRNAEIENIHSMEYMIYATSEWAKENGYESMHLGGGSSQLHQFKDGCTDKRVKYYIGNAIYLPQIYQLLSNKFCQRYPEQKNCMYLPIYRSKE